MRTHRRSKQVLHTDTFAMEVIENGYENESSSVGNT